MELGPLRTAEWPGPVAAGFGGHGDQNRDIEVPEKNNPDGLGDINPEHEKNVSEIQ